LNPLCPSGISPLAGGEYVPSPAKGSVRVGLFAKKYFILLMTPSPRPCVGGQATPPDMGRD